MNFFNICKPDGSQGRSLQWVHGGAKKLQTTCTKSNSLVKVSTNKIHRLYTYIYNIMDPLISLWVKELKTFNYSFKIKRLKRWRSLTDWKRKKPEEKERKAETQRNVSDVERGSGKVRLSNMKRRKSCRWSRQMEGWLLSARWPQSSQALSLISLIPLHGLYLPPRCSPPRHQSPPPTLTLKDFQLL